VHRSALPGIVLLMVGPVLLAFSGGLGATGGKAALFTLGGIIVTVIGLLLLAPLAIAALAVIARRPPIATRIALRDLVRYRARSAAALAATSFAILIAVLIILLATGRFADPVDYVGPNLPSNQLIVYAPSLGPTSGGGGPAPAAPGSQQSTAELQSRASAIAAALGSRDVLALEVSNAFLQGPRRGDSTNPLVATPAVLRHYGIDPGAIDPNTLLITSRPGLQGASGLQLMFAAGNANQSGPPDFRAVANPKIQTFSSLPTYSSDPNLLVTAYGVRKLGLQATPAAWLIQTPKPLNALQINSARQTAAAAGMTIETTNDEPSLAQLRTYATVAGILLALGVLAMTVGLIRRETAGDLRTLTATGASIRVRRNITSATAGTIALLGALLGTVVAYLATVAFFRSQLSERMGQAPVLDLVLILVGLPVVATVGGWLFAGREPPAIARQPIE
jgi:putative ABC transport system permease protein